MDPFNNEGLGPRPTSNPQANSNKKRKSNLLKTNLPSNGQILFLSVSPKQQEQDHHQPNQPSLPPHKISSLMATGMMSSLNTPKTVKFSDPAKSMQPNSISKVRVVVRVRPFLPHEIEAGNGNPVSCASVLDHEIDYSEEVAVHLKDQHTSRNECYKLDSFFNLEDNNVGQIFNREVSPLIPGIFQGCNATIFAYGATGSGKTYTMQGNDEMPGLMPLAMSTVLAVCQSIGSTAEISYYEVYMDRCYDLLEVKAKEITVLDDKDGQIHLKGLSRIPVNSISEFHDVFSCGIQRRKVAHTGLNDVSSRSHGVLVISVSTPYYGGDGSGCVINGKLNLIDLAGNEDNRRTCNEGLRLQESAKINQSLFALSNVIYALNNNMPRVPYRESKLTRILQDSLGGTSRALMVACLNPGEYQESVHTVSLAARSRHISNFVSSAKKLDTPKVKVDMEEKLRAWLESKGKGKSAQKMGAFGSPFFTKTPKSNPVKKPNTSHRSAKSKPNTNQGGGGGSGLKLKEGAVFLPQRNLFNNGGLLETWMENLDLASKDNGQQEFKDAADWIISESEADIIPDDQLDNEQKMQAMKSANFIGLSPIRGIMVKAFENSSRKVLSPLDSNINRNTLEDFSYNDHKCSSLFEAKTPKTPFFLTRENNDSQTFGTPLDKFNAQSSNLKSSLVQGYIDFLNTASKDELLELKGIGSKRAEYILELRETSPLKSLNDLKNIGLSSKQVHNMFSRAASVIFD